MLVTDRVQAPKDLLGRTLPSAQWSKADRRAYTEAQWKAHEQRQAKDRLERLVPGCFVHLKANAFGNALHEVLAVAIVDNDERYSTVTVAAWTYDGARRIERTVLFAQVDEIVDLANLDTAGTRRLETAHTLVA